MNNKCTLFICQDGIQKFTTWPKCHNTCKQVGSEPWLISKDLTHWTQISSQIGTVVLLFYSWHYSWFARMSTSPSVGLFETIHFWRSYDRLSHYLHTDDCCDARYSYCCHTQHPAIYIQYCEPGHVIITQAAQAH